MQADPKKLELIIYTLRNQYNVEEIWLFGSRAKCPARNNSDYDIMCVVSDLTLDDAINNDSRYAITQKIKNSVDLDLYAKKRSVFYDKIHIEDPYNFSYICVTQGKKIFPI